MNRRPIVLSLLGCFAACAAKPMPKANPETVQRPEPVASSVEPAPPASAELAVVPPETEYVRVGIIHSLSGTLAVGETQLKNRRIGANLWKQAVESAKSFDTAAVTAALANQTFAAPSGVTVTVDPDNHHLHKPYFVAEVGSIGSATVVWKTPSVIPPLAPAPR
jgi:hypothetical protein